jgi:hypothetical protein
MAEGKEVLARFPIPLCVAPGRYVGIAGWEIILIISFFSFSSKKFFWEVGPLLALLELS